MPLRFPAQSRKPNSPCSLFLAITILLLVSTSAAQDPVKTQEDAVKSLMTECLQLGMEGSPASFTKAIEKCESARVSLHSLNIPEGEGVMLVITGYAYSQLDQNQKALEKYEQSVSLFRAAGVPRGEATALLQL